jgi:catechol 2,3-dioxygenase-like lactoylglutathione lyase family enzyme
LSGVSPLALRLLLSLLASLLAGACAHGHPQGRAATPAAFMAVSVADLSRSVRWYESALGFSLVRQGELPGQPGRFALLQRSAALLELLQFPDGKALGEGCPDAPPPHLVHGFFKGGFVVADLDAEFSAVRARGVPFEFEVVRPPAGVYRVFGLRDPDGNLIQVFGP